MQSSQNPTPPIKNAIKLEPIRFDNDATVFQLLQDLAESGLITIRRNRNGEVDGILIPDPNKFEKEFVVGVDGHTYRREHIQTLHRRGHAFKINCDILTTAMLTEKNAKPIKFSHFGENDDQVVYNEVLANLLSTLNPNPEGLLQIKAPACNQNKSQKVLFPVGFALNTVTDRIADLAGRDNIAAQDLLALGHLQKIVYAANVDSQTNKVEAENLKEEIDEFHAMLDRKANTLNRMHAALVEQIDSANQVIQRLTPEYNRLLQTPEYANLATRPLNEINQALSRATLGVSSNKDRLFPDFTGLILFGGIGLFTGPWHISRILHWRKRIEPYTTILNFRNAQQMVVDKTNELLSHTRYGAQLLADINHLRTYTAATSTAAANNTHFQFFEQQTVVTEERQEIIIPAKGTPPPRR